MKNRCLLLVAVIAGLLSIGAAPGPNGLDPTMVYKPGDPVKYEFKAMDGTMVNTEDMKGKIMLLDFWALWCGKCMAAMPHMVELQETYGPQGLEIIGINMDNGKGEIDHALRVCPAIGANWPNYNAPGVTNVMAHNWGATGIPRMGLIGPDGTVLWHGKHAGVQEAIEKAFKETPPFLAGKDLEKATTICDQIDAALKVKETDKAFALLNTLPSLAKPSDKTLGARIKSIQENLIEVGNSKLAEADALVKDNKLAEAIVQLQKLSNNMSSTPVGAGASKKLAEITATKDGKAALEQAHKLKDSDARLAAAKVWKERKLDEATYCALRVITYQYPGTPAAQAAADELKSDPKYKEIGEKLDAAVAKQAPVYLKVADTLAAKAPDKAAEKYQEVVERYPGTTSAEQAAIALAKIPRKIVRTDDDGKPDSPLTPPAQPKDK